jgi:carboxymethylenebutenolidase
MPSVTTSTVTLQVPQATPMDAFVARPAGAGPHPGLMVFQEAYGVNPHIRDVTTRFANQGYVAIAPELFHRTGPGFEGRYGDFEGTKPHFNAINTPDLEADIRATFAWLRQTGDVAADRIHAVGYCMGGRVSFLANLVVPVASTVSYYGGRIVPELLSRVSEAHGPALCFWGGLDQHIGLEGPRQLADAMRAAGKRHVHVEISDTDHAFFCDARGSYNARAARESWALTLDFLKP